MSTTAQHETTGTIPAWTPGDRLRKARESAGLSQQQLADRIGISRGSVTNYESDKHPVRRIVLNAWAAATGMNLEWLRDGIDPDPGDAPRQYSDILAAA